MASTFPPPPGAPGPLASGGAPVAPPVAPPPPPPPAPGAHPAPPRPGGPPLTPFQPQFATKQKPRRTPEMLGYRPIDALGTVLVALFVVWLPLALYMVNLALRERRLVHKYGVVQDLQPFVERNALDEKIAIANVLYFGLLGITGIVFLIWFARAYSNLPTISAGRTSRGTFFATACWFIPFLNIVRPLGFMKEIWERTEPLDSRRKSPATLITVYWICYIASSVIQVFIGQSYLGNVDDQRFGADLLVLQRLVFVAVTVLLGLVVYKLTRRMTSRCEEVTKAVLAAPQF